MGGRPDLTSVLIVEDEPRLAAFLERALAASGYATEVCEDGESALRLVERDFDLLVLDLRMPEVDGAEILRRLRQRGEDPVVLILRDRGDPGAGAEASFGDPGDPAAKPVALGDLLAGVRFRTPPAEPVEPPVLEAAGIVLDRRARRARVEGRTVELTARELALLDSMMRHPGQVLSKQQLLDDVWGYGYDLKSNLVEVYVGYLRRKLRGDAIETVRGVGYRLRGGTAR